MRGACALGLLSMGVLACSGAPQVAPSSTPGPVSAATRTAIATTIAQSPPAVRTAVAAVFDAPQTVGAPDYVAPQALLTDTARYVGKGVLVQGQAGGVRERDKVVYFTLLALPRGDAPSQLVSVQSFGETSAMVRQGNCYRVEGVGAGADQALPFIIGFKIREAAPASASGCAPP